MFGIANEVHQDLQRLVFIHRNGLHLGVFSDQLDRIAVQRAAIKSEGILYQIFDIKVSITPETRA